MRRAAPEVVMRAHGTMIGRLLVFTLVAVVCAGVSSLAARERQRGPRAPGPTLQGPWVEEGWDREDWGRAPAVRAWGFSAPWDYGLYFGAPSSDEYYPWGYTTPFVRVGRKCVASELNRSPGGELIRYQRVRPSYYCN
jgi:hypothetical protein